jgi:hypothetical protein
VCLWSAGGQQLQQSFAAALQHILAGQQLTAQQQAALAAAPAAAAGELGAWITSLFKGICGVCLLLQPAIDILCVTGYLLYLLFLLF